MKKKVILAPFQKVTRRRKNSSFSVAKFLKSFATNIQQNYQYIYYI